MDIFRLSKLIKLTYFHQNRPSGKPFHSNQPIEAPSICSFGKLSGPISPQTRSRENFKTTYWTFLLIAFLLLIDSGITGSAFGQTEPAGNQQNQTGQGSRVLQLPTPIVTPRKNFDIPFHIDDPVGKLIEVQLYVSTDQAKTWNLYSRTSPQKKKFPFQSVGDGQYLFALKTLDRDRRLLPVGPPVPTLNIVVDTKQPDLLLQVDPGTGGRVVTSFRASDPNLVAETLSLSYRLDGAGLPGKWIPINLPKKDLRTGTAKGKRPTANSAEIISDRVSWWPEQGASAIVVKAEIKDQAGNLKTTYQPINLSALTQVRTQTPPTAISNHLKAPIQKSAQNPGNRIKATPASARKQVNNNQLGSDQHPLSPIPQNTGDKGAVRWEPTKRIGTERVYAEKSSSSPFRSIQSGTQNQFPTNQANQTTINLWAPDKPEPAQAKALIQDDQFHPSQPKSIAGGQKTPPKKSTKSLQKQGHYDQLGTMGSVDGQLVVSESTSSLIPKSIQNNRPKENLPETGNNKNEFVGHSRPRKQNHSDQKPLGNQVKKETSINLMTDNNHQKLQAKPAGFKRFHVPENVRPFLVNRRSFRLRYEVNGLETKDVAAVTVFGSADGGATWAKIQNDTDKKSPVQILVNQPGVYGFRVVITSRTGVNSPVPKPGDKPDVYVEVDLSAPTPKITSARYSLPGESSHLAIDWSATEPDLSARPISIAYSNRPAGPWTNIAVDLENNGSFKWMVGPNLPKQVYLRIAAKDKAGNIGYHQLPDPINIAPLIPRGKVLGIDR